MPPFVAYVLIFISIAYFEFLIYVCMDIDVKEINTTREAIRKIFVPTPLLAEFLFLQYQVQARRLAEVAGR